jgi:hypothetical protein
VSFKKRVTYELEVKDRDPISGRTETFTVVILVKEWVELQLHRHLWDENGLRVQVLYSGSWGHDQVRGYGKKLPPDVNPEWAYLALRTLREATGKLGEEIVSELFHRLEILPACGEKGGWLREFLPNYLDYYIKMIEAENIRTVEEVMSA